MTEFKIGAGTTEDQLQQFFAYLFAQATTGTATTGVLAGLSVTQTATASASVLVNIGAAVSQSSLTAGADPLLNNAQKTIDVLTANPMGATPRNDLIVFDPADATVKLLVGTPNVTPTDPAAPAGAVPLARLRNAASATTVPAASIDDLRVFTGSLGGFSGGRRRVAKQISVTTTGSGDATVTHGLGWTPAIIVVDSPVIGIAWGCDNKTATTFGFHTRLAATGGAYNSTQTYGFVFWE